MRDVRDAPALPNELRAAMVTCLLVSLSMSSALSSDQYLVVLALGELGD